MNPIGARNPRSSCSRNVAMKAKRWRLNRQRAPSWWLVGISATTAALAAVATQSGLPMWVSVVVGVTAIAPLVISEVRVRRDQRDHLNVLLRASVSTASNRIRRMADTSPRAAGVHRAMAAVPYVSRGAEANAEQQLSDGRLLIVGPAMAGKTRLALEVSRKLYPAARVSPAQGRSSTSRTSRGWNRCVRLGDLA